MVEDSEIKKPPGEEKLLTSLFLEKRYKLSNAKCVPSSEVSLESELVTTTTNHRKPSKLGHQSISVIYEIHQAPFGDSYVLSEDEKISLMLMEAASYVPDPDGQGYLVTGRTRNGVLRKKVPDLELAKRCLRDFLPFGTKLDLTLREYLLRSPEWQSGFGGYFLPVNFSRNTPLPFDPSDVPYLTPETPGPKYLESSREVRLALLRSYVDRFGRDTEKNYVELRASPKTLMTIQDLAKSLGIMAGPLEEPGVYGLLSATPTLGRPMNAYPIQVKPLGKFEYYATPGEFKVLFGDGTVGWW